MIWSSVTAAASTQDERDLIAALLIEAGASGVQEQGEKIITYLDDDTDFSTLVSHLRARVPRADVQVRKVGEIAIDTTWTARVGVQRLGRLVIAPPWLAEEASGSGHLIVIDPATAFGTGDHPSTRLVLLLMQGVVKHGDLVADVGAGSAVLSIAAARLGARRIAAIEMDAGSIGNAEENIARNGEGDRVKVIEGDAAVLLPLVAPVRVILANIISSVILDLEPVVRRTLDSDGRVLISGVLVAESAELAAELTRRGWRVVRELTEGDWWAAEIARG